MSRLLITSDLHLGHKNISKYRTNFSSSEEHHGIIYDNLASSVNKSDTLYLLGDVAFDKYWLNKIKDINCKHKKLVCGNHDRDHHTMSELCDVFDSVDCLLSKRNVWFTHCPIHPQEIRSRIGVVHGHLHHKLVEVDGVVDKRYFNACVEHTDWKPISYQDIIKITGWK